MSRFEITVLRSVAQLEELASEWEALSGPFATPLLDHDWFACAARAFHRESELRVVVVREHGKLVAAAPLAADSARHLVLLGSPVLHEPSGWLYASPDALHHLIRTLVHMGQVIVLDRIAAPSVAAELLPPRMRWHALTIRRWTAESCVVPTDVAWDAYCASLSSRTRKKLTEAHNRAERHYGPVRFTRITATPDEAGRTLSTLVDIEAAGWKARQGTALSSRPALLRFFECYSKRAAARNRLRVSMLRIGETTAAIELGVEAYGRMWGLKVAYDERFAAVAPALQLIHASIEASFVAGLSAYEFLGSAEPWQERWRPQRRRYQLAAIYPLRPGAMIIAMRDIAGHLSRRMQRQPEQGVVA